MALSVSGFPEHASRHVHSQSQSQNVLSLPSSSSSSSSTGIDPESLPTSSSLMNSPRLRGLFGKSQKPQLQAQENTGTDFGSPLLPLPPPQATTATVQEYDYDLQIEMPIPIPLPPLGQPPRPKRPQPIPIPRQTTASPVRLQPSLARLEIGRTVITTGVKGEGAASGRASILPSEGGMKAVVGGPSRSPPPLKMGSTYQQQQVHQGTPSSKVLLPVPFPQRHTSSSSTPTTAAKMRYQPLVVVDPPSPVPSSASPSTASTGSSALTSTTLSDPPSSASPIVRSFPPPLHSAPLTNTNANTINRGRPFVPPRCAKVKRPRTSPGSISIFAAGTGTTSRTSATSRTPKSSLSTTTTTTTATTRGGMPISSSYSWASRPVDLHPSGSPRITQTQKMMTNGERMTRRRDHSADSFLARSSQLVNPGGRQTTVVRAHRPRSTSTSRKGQQRLRSGEPSPLRSSITFGDGAAGEGLPLPVVPLGDLAIELPPIRPQPHITTSWITQFKSESLDSSPVGSPTPTATTTASGQGQGRERPVLTLSAVGVGSSSGTRPWRSATLPSSPSPITTPTLSVQTTPTRLTLSIQTTPTTLLSSSSSNETDSSHTHLLRDFSSLPDTSSSPSMVASPRISTSASPPIFTRPFPTSLGPTSPPPPPSSSSSPPSSSFPSPPSSSASSPPFSASSSPPFSASSSPPRFMHPFPSSYQYHTCTGTQDGGDALSISSPTSPIEFLVDDDGTTLSGCGGDGDEYYYTWSGNLGRRSGSEEPSPSPIRYAPPEGVGWADADDGDGFSEGSCLEEGGDGVDIPSRTDEGGTTRRKKKKRRRKSHPGNSNLTPSSSSSSPPPMASDPSSPMVYDPSSPMSYDPPSPMAYAPPSPADDVTVSPISLTTGRGRRRRGLPRSYRVDYSAPGSPGVGFEFVMGRRGGSLERGREREHVKGRERGEDGEEEEQEERGRRRTSRSRGSIPGRQAMGIVPDRKLIPIPKRKFADAVSMAFFEDGRLRGRRKRGKSVGASVGAGSVGGGEEHAFVLDISLEGEAGVGGSSFGGESQGGKKEKKKGKAVQRERTESASGSSSAFSLDDDDDDDDDDEGREKTAVGSTTPFMWVSKSKPTARYQSTPIIPIPVALPSNRHQYQRHGFVSQDEEEEEEWEGEVPNNLSCGLTLLAGPSSPPLYGKKGGRGRTKSAGSVSLASFGFGNGQTQTQTQTQIFGERERVWKGVL